MEYLLQDLLKLPLSERIRIIETMFIDIWKPESTGNEKESLSALVQVAHCNTTKSESKF